MVLSQRKNKRKNHVFGRIVLILTTVGSVLIGLYPVLENEEVKGYIRQTAEERLIDSYERKRCVIASACQETEEIEETEEIKEIKEIEKYSEVEIDAESEAGKEICGFRDDAYYVIDGIEYTPEFAKGYLDCVLEIPSIGLRRGVYSGTEEEIAYDLDIWMITAASPMHVLGQTHYCIYGHNSLSQDLSFNRISELDVGEIFYLMTDEAVLVFEITDTFAEWRETATADYVYNFNIPKEKCYLITCGRNEYACRDLLVEGTLRNEYTRNEWEHRKENARKEGAIRKEYMQKEGERGKEETEQDKASAQEEVTCLSASVEDNILTVSIKTQSGAPIQNAEIVFSDGDGMFLKNKNGEVLSVKTDREGQCSINIDLLPADQTSYFGIKNRIDGYTLPGDLCISVIREDLKVYGTVTKPESASAVCDYEVFIIAGMTIFGLITIIACGFWFIDKKEASRYNDKAAQPGR